MFRKIVFFTRAAKFIGCHEKFGAKEIPDKRPVHGEVQGIGFQQDQTNVD
jgi:hypothetical protein